MLISSDEIHRRALANTLFGVEGSLGKLFEDEIAMILKKMLEKIKLSNPSAVITTSALYGHAETEALKSALNTVGINTEEIISDTIAVVIGQYFDSQIRMRSSDVTNVLVFDLGIGKFEVTVAAVKLGAYGILASKNSKDLGGIDFTNKIMEYCISLFYAKHEKLIRGDKLAMDKLRGEAEQAKIELSSRNQVRIRINSLYEGIDFDQVLTRDQFNQMNIYLFHQTIELATLALKESELDTKELNHVLLVGPSTAIPKLRQLIEKVLFLNKSIIVSHTELSEVAVRGASYKAVEKDMDPFVLKDKSYFKKHSFNTSFNNFGYLLLVLVLTYIFGFLFYWFFIFCFLSFIFPRFEQSFEQINDSGQRITEFINSSPQETPVNERIRRLKTIKINQNIIRGNLKKNIC